MSKRSEKVLVAERAVLQRLNRKLRSIGPIIVKKTRPFTLGRTNLGAFYSIDRSRMMVDERSVNLEKLARELGVLAEWEIIKCL